jgi:hypothetical protein
MGVRENKPGENDTYLNNKIKYMCKALNLHQRALKSIKKLSQFIDEGVVI